MNSLESIPVDPSLCAAKLNAALKDSLPARCLPVKDAGSVAWSMVKHATGCGDEVDVVISTIHAIINTVKEAGDHHSDALYVTASAVLHALDSIPLHDPSKLVETMDSMLNNLIFPLLTGIITSTVNEKEVYEIMSVTADTLLKKSQGSLTCLLWVEDLIEKSVKVSDPRDDFISVRLSAHFVEVGGTLLLTDLDKMLKVYANAIHILTTSASSSPMACAARDLLQAILLSAKDKQESDARLYCSKCAEVLYSVCK